jgi:ferrochelatase
LVRQFLVRCVIAPLRARASAHAYRSIWTAAGSPQVVHGEALAAAVGGRFASRYGDPSVVTALDEASTMQGGGAEITVVPLFPQHASATVGSVHDVVADWRAHRPSAPEVRIVPPFWSHPAWIASVADSARPVIEEIRPDTVLFSYHGLPESQVRAECSRACADLASADAACCLAAQPPARCYRAQCLATSRLLSAELGVAHPLTAFQSRFGPARWIGPSTDEALRRLPSEGVRRLVVLCPSFVADCLETLEELGMRGRDTFLAAGGEAFALAPCPNGDARWLQSLLADRANASTSGSLCAAEKNPTSKAEGGK